MGEQACLRRSFSHPSSASRETKEGNPIRALTESISLGRFMSEPLAWEKWSTFSHNRYLEEAEMFSKPGSVAQMKAYFEAHYKDRAAKKAVALPGQQNALTVNIHKTKNAGKADSGSSGASKSTVTTNDNKQQNKGVFDSKPTHFAHAKTFCLNGQRDLSEIANQSDTSSPMDSESVMSNGDNKQQGIFDTRPAYFAPANGFDLNGQTDLSENAQMEGCDKVKGESVEFESPSKVEIPRQLEVSENNNKWTVATEDKMPQKEAAEKENAALAANKRRMNLSSKLSSQTKSSKLPKSSATPVSSTQPKTGVSVAFDSKKSAGSLVDKKRLTPKSVHMSINFGSQSRETSKSSLRMSKQSSATPKNSIRASVYRESKSPSILPSSEERSCSNSSNPSGSKAQCPITSSPFSLKCEERAVRRKEFFKKVEDKKEAEKMHLQEKAVLDPKRAQQRICLRGKPYDDLHQSSQSPGNRMKKMPSTQPRSPKLGGKPTSSTVQESSFQRSAVNAENPELATQKANQGLTRSVISLPKRKVHQSSSPNTWR